MERTQQTTKNREFADVFIFPAYDHCDTFNFEHFQFTINFRGIENAMDHCHWENFNTWILRKYSKKTFQNMSQASEEKKIFKKKKQIRNKSALFVIN